MTPNDLYLSLRARFPMLEGAAAALFRRTRSLRERLARADIDRHIFHGVGAAVAAGVLFAVTADPYAPAAPDAPAAVAARTAPVGAVTLAESPRMAASGSGPAEAAAATP